MSDPYAHIERQIRHIGDPHARVSMKDRLDASDTMRQMLEVVRAVKKVNAVAWADDAGGYDPAWFEVEEALAKLEKQ